MKKGISLIVLVITIIVMIIIAGAIIISLNSSNVIDSANNAVDKSNVANVKSLLALQYAEIMDAKYNEDSTDDPTLESATADYKAALEASDLVVTESGSDLRIESLKATVSIDATTFVPTVTVDEASGN